MSDSNLVLCRDCKHRFKTLLDTLMFVGSDRCKLAYNPPTVEIDPVVGEKKIPGSYDLCVIQRMYGSKGCGRSGKNWQPRDKKQLFVYLKRI